MCLSIQRRQLRQAGEKWTYNDLSVRAKNMMEKSQLVPVKMLVDRQRSRGT